MMLSLFLLQIVQMLNKFYTDVCDEEKRLIDRVGNIEFITTTKYIDNVLKEGDSILETLKIKSEENTWKEDILKEEKINITHMKSMRRTENSMLHFAMVK